MASAGWWVPPRQRASLLGRFAVHYVRFLLVVAHLAAPAGALAAQGATLAAGARLRVRRAHASALVGRITVRRAVG